jgi:hypothetical protein
MITESSERFMAVLKDKLITQSLEYNSNAMLPFSPKSQMSQYNGRSVELIGTASKESRSLKSYTIATKADRISEAYVNSVKKSVEPQSFPQRFAI